MKLSPPIRPYSPTGALEEDTLLDPITRRPSRIGGFLRRNRWFLLLVVLPVAIASVYFYGFAAPQYESEAKFLIRTKTGASSGNPASDLLAGAGFRTSQEDALAIRDFLESRDALRGLFPALNPVEIWRRPEADGIARLWDAEPPIEKLLRYYHRMVSVAQDSASGTVTVRVRAFRPEDARDINEALLRQSENVVNRLGERAREDSLNVAREEVNTAEKRVIAAREALTAFRTRESALDPTSEAKASVELVARLEGALIETRAELQEKSAYMRADNPVVRNLQNRVAALTQQIAAERRRLTSGDGTVTQQLAGYERLLLEREFADKMLASATGSLESARVEAQRQQLFLARVVQPGLAEYADYPRAAFTLGGLFAVLCVVYGEGWLLLSGIREHAA